VSDNDTRLFVYVGEVDTQLPLPERYLRLDGIRLVNGTGRAGNTCSRCRKQWRQHAWVLYGTNFGEPFDCSNLPREAS
jgi:hypothetical protein